MLKSLKTILAALLVISLLITGLSFAALSEAVPAEPVETQTEIPAEAPAAEVTEVPAEEPAAEATEVLAGEPAAEATEVPTEEPTAEATEAPAEEPAAEATEVPTEEPVVEATEAPAEESSDASEPSDELSDEQKAALENLPAGFGTEAVALAMMRSSGCAHTGLSVHEDIDYNSCVYTSLDEDHHTVTYKLKRRILYCQDCFEEFQTVTVNQTDSEKRVHEWIVTGIGTKISVKCEECGYAKKVEPPCSHKNSFGTENVVLFCNECGANVGLSTIKSTNDCKHAHYTIYGTRENPYIWYSAFSKEQHVKTYEINTYGDVFDAECNDCGNWLGVKNGKVIYENGFERDASDYEFTGVLESHTFENGVCKFCGEAEAEKVCDHSAGNYRDELDESVAPKYSNITETTHCVQHSYKRYCKDCGQYIKNVVDEGITPVEHDFSKGNTCPCGKKRIYTIFFSNISGGDTATAGKDLNVSWTQVEGIDHYEFAARYTDEDGQCVEHRNFGLNTTAAVPSVKYNKTLQLWVGAFEKSGDQQPVCSATIQVKTTECDHRADPDGWKYVKAEKRYVKDDSGHVLQEVTLFDIDCSICGAQLRNYEGMVYSYPKEQHSKGNTEIGSKKSYYTAVDAEWHEVHKEATQTCTCVCGYQWTENVKLSGDGTKEKHALDSDGKCTLCGYGDYEQEVERIRKQIESVYSDLCAGENYLKKEYPNGFGGYGGPYRCGVFVGLQARYLGFDYLGCNGTPFSGQPDGRNWCNYSRDASHDWASSTAGLGKDMEIVNTVDGKRYVQRIYLDKDANECCLKDLLAANDYQNLYNVIISYSQKGNTSPAGHVRYIYAILKDPSSGKWMVFFSDNMTSKGGVQEGKMVSCELDEFITWSRKYYYINGVIHFEPQE